MSNLILASQSETRQKMLSNYGVSFRAIPAHIDEEAIKTSLINENTKPRDIVDYLAEMKALAVSRTHPGSYCIGSDQILVFERMLLSKAKTKQDAHEKISKLAGKTHTLMSAVVIARDGKTLWRDLDKATLTMKPLKDDEIDEYIKAAGEGILSSVGCYQLESLGKNLMREIKGNTDTILGMPMKGLLQQLRLYDVV